MWKLSTTIKGISVEPRTVLRVPPLPKKRHAADPGKIKQKAVPRAGQHDQHKPRSNAKSAKWDSVHNWHISARRISHKARMATPYGRHRAHLPDRVTAHPGEIRRDGTLALDDRANTDWRPRSASPQPVLARSSRASVPSRRTPRSASPGSSVTVRNSGSIFRRCTILRAPAWNAARLLNGRSVRAWRRRTPIPMRL